MRRVVIVVEDDEAVARVMVRVLSRRAEVRCARSVAEALPLIERGDFHALLCDWQLADGTGATVLARCRARLPEARRVLFSAHPADLLRGLVGEELVHVILDKDAEIDAITCALGV